MPLHRLFAIAVFGGFFCWSGAVCEVQAESPARTSQKRILRLSSLLTKAQIQSPKLVQGLFQLRARGIQNRTKSPYGRGKGQIYHPRLHPRAFSSQDPNAPHIDQQVTYRIHRGHHYYWAEESAFYLPTPTTLQFTLTIPPHASLHFGTGILALPYKAPMQAQIDISVSSPQSPQTPVFTTTIKPTYPWDLPQERQHQPDSPAAIAKTAHSTSTSPTLSPPNGRRQRRRLRRKRRHIRIHRRTPSTHTPTSQNLELFHNHKISLEKWAGQTVTLHIETRAIPSQMWQQTCKTAILPAQPPDFSNSSLAPLERQAQRRKYWQQRKLQRKCQWLQRQHRQHIGHVLLANPTLVSPPTSPSSTSPNVLLILVDTLRARSLGTYGQALPTSPNIDRFAKQGMLFERAYAVANRTRASVTGLLSSEFPDAIGASVGFWNIPDSLRYQFYQRRPPLLTRVLAKSGYRVDFIGNNYFLFNLYTRGLNFGFDRKIDFWRNHDTEHITEHSVRWLRKHRHQKFFLFVHYNAPHYPYPSPPRFTELLMPQLRKIPTHFHRRYLASVRFTDHHVGLLMRTLKQLDLERNTLVVFVADHGEVFEVHHNKRLPVKERSLFNHGNTMYESELHVPLIFRLPGKIPAHRRISTPVSLIDVAPTILSALNIPIPPEYQGKVLTPAPPASLAQRPIFAEANGMRTVRQGAWKLILRFGKFANIKQPDGTFISVPQELYNLEQDPQERQNLAEQKPQIVRQLRQKLYIYMRTNRQRRQQVWIGRISPSARPSAQPQRTSKWRKRRKRLRRKRVNPSRHTQHPSQPRKQGPQRSGD